MAKIHAGSIIEALHEQILTGNPADASPIGQAFVGQHLYVVAGPVRRDALWFLVQWQQSRSAPPSLGWMQIYPLNPFVFRLIDPPCPRSIPDLATIVGMIPAERLLCFGDRELTFAPVVITELGTGVEVDGQPIWLAPEPNLAMYDSSGPEGLNGSIPVYLSPDTNGAFLPFGGLLAVKGHFDDPAARGCHRVVRSEQVSPPLTPETPAAQVLRCRENFVITSAHEIPVADGSPVP